MQISDFFQMMLRKCLQDYVGLYRIIESVYPEIKSDKPVPTWVYQKSIETVKGMLESGLFVIGFLNPENGDNEFTPLAVSIDAALEFLQKEWKNGDATAFDVGYSCWFQATTAGEQVAHELHLI